MLDMMRRHLESWVLKSILAIIVGAFIGSIFFLWGMGGPEDTASTLMAAKVNGRLISIVAYQQALDSRMRLLRNIYKGGGSIEKLLANMNIPQRVLDELIEKELLTQEANSLGFTASDEEVRRRIASTPTFQEDGIFNPTLYRQILEYNHIRPHLFEQELRQEIIIQKLGQLIRGRVKVLPAEVYQEYVYRSEKVKLEYLVFNPINYDDEVSFTEDEINTYFEQYKENYGIPAQRRAEYLFLDPGKLEKQPSEVEMAEYYELQQDEYFLPKQVKAGHILIKIPSESAPEEEEKARKLAEDVRKKALAGESFAKLAEQYSQDEATAKKGGDLGYFSKGRMVPVFEEAAFGMEPGQISEVVRTPFGYHVIKVADVQAERQQSLEEVKPRLVSALKKEKGWEEAMLLADKLYGKLQGEDELSKIGDLPAVELRPTDFFAQGDVLPRLGRAKEFNDAVFELEPGQISAPIKLSRGYAIVKLNEVRPSRIPELSEVKDKVTNDLKAGKARDLAHQKAVEVREREQAGASLEDLAETYKVELKDGGEVSRRGSITGIGRIAPWSVELFNQKPGEISAVLTRENDPKAYLIIVKEKIPPDEEKFPEEQGSIAQQLLQRKSKQVFDAWAKGLREEAEVEIAENLWR